MLWTLRGLRTSIGLLGAAGRLILAGCASSPPKGGSASGGRPAAVLADSDRDGAEARPPAGLDKIPDAEPRVEPIRVGGPNKPYEALGRSYVPLTEDRPYHRARPGVVVRPQVPRPAHVERRALRHVRDDARRIRRCRSRATRASAIRPTDARSSSASTTAARSMPAASSTSATPRRCRLGPAARRRAGRSRAHHLRRDPRRRRGGAPGAADAPRTRRPARRAGPAAAARDGADDGADDGSRRRRRSAPTTAPMAAPQRLADGGGRRRRADRRRTCRRDVDGRAADGAAAGCGARLLGPARRLPPARRRDRVPAPHRRRVRLAVAAGSPSSAMRRCSASRPGRIRAATRRAMPPRASARRCSSCR